MVYVIVLYRHLPQVMDPYNIWKEVIREEQ